ncbi:hypothetical protein [Halorussus halophilus]|uniref:hypothetical protein n=1 Tax=Halorussus halophilus TaxID=2650975 RepID=UPI0034A0D4F1
MGIRSGAQGWLANRRFDVNAAVIGLVMALAMFPLRFVIDQIYVETVPLVLGLACLLYLAAAYTDNFSSGLPTVSRPVSRLLPSIALVGMAMLILVAVLSGGRTLLFYSIAGITGTVVLIQTLFTHEEDFQTALYLFEIVTLAFIVRFAALYTTPGLIGIDIWTHIYGLAAQIQEANSLSAIANNKHVASPLFHLIVVTTSMFADVSLRTGLYLSIGIVMPLSVLLVYATTAHIVNARWAVIAALLFSFGDYFIEWGIHLIPTSHGLIFYLAVLYMLVRVMRTDYRMRDFGLLVFLTVAVIFTHQVSSFIMLVLLGAALLAQLVLQLGLFDPPDAKGALGSKNPANLVGLLVFDMGLAIFTWSLTPYNQGSFLGTVLSYLTETIESSAGFGNTAQGVQEVEGVASQIPDPTLLEQVTTYIDATGFLLLLFGAFVGCLYVVNRRHARHSVFTLLISSAFMLVFVLGLPMFGIRNFIPQRWFAFLYAPLAILTAVGFRYFSAELDPRIFAVGLVIFALVFPGAMVMSNNGTLDNPAFDHQTRVSYTQTELAAVDSIAEMTGSPESGNLLPQEVIYSDQPYYQVFMRTGSYPAEMATVPANDTQVNRNVTVYREYQSTGAPLWNVGTGVGWSSQIDKSRMCRPNQATLYTNGDVRLCVDNSQTRNVDN